AATSRESDVEHRRARSMCVSVTSRWRRRLASSNACSKQAVTSSEHVMRGVSHRPITPSYASGTLDLPYYFGGWSTTSSEANRRVGDLRRTAIVLSDDEKPAACVKLDARRSTSERGRQIEAHRHVDVIDERRIFARRESHREDFTRPLVDPR